jgi:transcriptional regulator with XRE-family HTH domain
MERTINLKALALIRKKKGISQEKVGQAIGKDESTYGRIEAGKIEIKAKDIPIIANVLDVPVMDIAEAIFFDNDAA